MSSIGEWRAALGQLVGISNALRGVHTLVDALDQADQLRSEIETRTRDQIKKLEEATADLDQAHAALADARQVARDEAQRIVEVAKGEARQIVEQAHAEGAANIDATMNTLKGFEVQIENSKAQLATLQQQIAAAQGQHEQMQGALAAAKDTVASLFK